MTKKTMAIVSLDLDCTAKVRFKNIVGATIPDYFALIDPYCRLIFTGEKYITSEILEQILSLTAVEINERMAPEARLLIPLLENVHLLTPQDKAAVLRFFTSIYDSKFSLTVFVADKSIFLDAFPDINKIIPDDHILDGVLFKDQKKSVKYMLSTNAKAKKAYDDLKKLEKHSSYINHAGSNINHDQKQSNTQLFFSSSSKVVVHNQESNQVLKFVMAIILALSLRVIFCKRSNKRKNKPH